MGWFLTKVWHQVSHHPAPNPPRNRQLPSRLVIKLSSSELRKLTLPIHTPFHLLFLACILCLLKSVSGSPNPRPIMANAPELSATVVGLGREVVKSDRGSYSLFPDEDLRTGKKVRFEEDLRSSGGSSLLGGGSTLGGGSSLRFDDRNRNYDRSRDFNYNRRDRDYNYNRDRDQSYPKDRLRSYPIMFEDRLHRPGSFREELPDRNRGSRVYFDDDKYRSYSGNPYPSNLNGGSSSSGNRYQPGYYEHDHMPPLLDRPISPVRSHSSNPTYTYNSQQNYNDYARPYQLHHHYRQDVAPGPSLSKLPVRASDIINSDVPTRVHVFDPESGSFGNPRNSGGARRTETTTRSNRLGGFTENIAPGPELFLNHEMYLEYHRKIALAREIEFRKLQKALKAAKKGNNQNKDKDQGSKKILFASNQPFDILSENDPDDDPRNENDNTRDGSRNSEEQNNDEPEDYDKATKPENSGVVSAAVDVDDIGQKVLAVVTGEDGKVSLIGVKDEPTRTKGFTSGTTENNNGEINNSRPVKTSSLSGQQPSVERLEIVENPPTESSSRDRLELEKSTGESINKNKNAASTPLSRPNDSDNDNDDDTITVRGGRAGVMASDDISRIDPHRQSDFRDFNHQSQNNNQKHLPLLKQEKVLEEHHHSQKDFQLEQAFNLPRQASHEKLYTDGDEFVGLGVVERENGKSQVTQMRLPEQPSFISKSGRDNLVYLRPTPQPNGLVYEDVETTSSRKMPTTSTSTFIIATSDNILNANPIKSNDQIQPTTRSYDQVTYKSPVKTSTTTTSTVSTTKGTIKPTAAAKSLPRMVTSEDIVASRNGFVPIVNIVGVNNREGREQSISTATARSITATSTGKSQFPNNGGGSGQDVTDFGAGVRKTTVGVAEMSLNGQTMALISSPRPVQFQQLQNNQVGKMQRVNANSFGFGTGTDGIANNLPVTYVLPGKERRMTIQDFESLMAKVPLPRSMRSKDGKRLGTEMTNSTSTTSTINSLTPTTADRTYPKTRKGKSERSSNKIAVIKQQELRQRHKQNSMKNYPTYFYANSTNNGFNNSLSVSYTPPSARTVGFSSFNVNSGNLRHKPLNYAHINAFNSHKNYRNNSDNSDSTQTNSNLYNGQLKQTSLQGGLQRVKSRDQLANTVIRMTKSSQTSSISSTRTEKNINTQSNYINKNANANNAQQQPHTFQQPYNAQQPHNQQKPHHIKPHPPSPKNNHTPSNTLFTINKINSTKIAHPIPPSFKPSVLKLQEFKPLAPSNPNLNPGITPTQKITPDLSTAVAQPLISNPITTQPPNIPSPTTPSKDPSKQFPQSNSIGIAANPLVDPKELLNNLLKSSRKVPPRQHQVEDAFLNNNDLMIAQPSRDKELDNEFLQSVNDGHFTLFSLNNDQVDVSEKSGRTSVSIYNDDHNNDNTNNSRLLLNDGDIIFDVHDTNPGEGNDHNVSTVVNLVEEEDDYDDNSDHQVKPLGDYEEDLLRGSDLDIDDSLILLGSNDAMVNKTLNFGPNKVTKGKNYGQINYPTHRRVNNFPNVNTFIPFPDSDTPYLEPDPDESSSFINVIRVKGPSATKVKKDYDKSPLPYSTLASNQVNFYREGSNANSIHLGDNVNENLKGLGLKTRQNKITSNETLVPKLDIPTEDKTASVFIAKKTDRKKSSKVFKSSYNYYPSSVTEDTNISAATINNSKTGRTATNAGPEDQNPFKNLLILTRNKLKNYYDVNFNGKSVLMTESINAAKRYDVGPAIITGSGNNNNSPKKNTSSESGRNSHPHPKVVWNPPIVELIDRGKKLQGQKNLLNKTRNAGVRKGVISKVHAHVSHCPKLHAPAEIICDIHIREGHNHPDPQLTVGWRRKFYNSTQPDVLLVLNKTKTEDEETTPSTPTLTSTRMQMVGLVDGVNSTLFEKESSKRESLEDFHDKFNVTLAPGISPMLRSVLLIRGVTAPDCGNYQCEVSDGVYTLTSETLLFLCH